MGNMGTFSRFDSAIAQQNTENTGKYSKMEPFSGPFQATFLFCQGTPWEVHFRWGLMHVFTVGNEQNLTKWGCEMGPFYGEFHLKIWVNLTEIQLDPTLTYGPKSRRFCVVFLGQGQNILWVKKIWRIEKDTIILDLEMVRI